MALLCLNFEENAILTSRFAAQGLKKMSFDYKIGYDLHFIAGEMGFIKA